MKTLKDLPLSIRSIALDRIEEDTGERPRTLNTPLWEHMSWANTVEGTPFWYSVLVEGDFSGFYKKYKTLPELARLITDNHSIPEYLAKKLLTHQYEQLSKIDPYVFIDNLEAGCTSGGMDWLKTPEGFSFWKRRLGQLESTEEKQTPPPISSKDLNAYVDSYTPTYKLVGFPKEVLRRLVVEQVKQGNTPDLSVFEKLLSTGRASGGFLWNETDAGKPFWERVLGGPGNFEHFFKKYPKPDKATKEVFDYTAIASSRTFEKNLRGFPIPIVAKMLERQHEVGNTPDLVPFEKSICSNTRNKGFDWITTPEKDAFWNAVLADRDFNQFFIRYPSETPPVKKEPDFEAIVKAYTPMYELKGVPLEIMVHMLKNQVAQGNEADLFIFDKNKSAGLASDGFSWDRTTEGHEFWHSVLTKKKYRRYFDKYPERILRTIDDFEGLISRCPYENAYKNCKYLGAIKPIPKAIVLKMLRYQHKHTGKIDIEIFVKRKFATADIGGFNWSNTSEGEEIWSKVLKGDYDILLKSEPANIPKGSFDYNKRRSTAPVLRMSDIPMSILAGTLRKSYYTPKVKKTTALKTAVHKNSMDVSWDIDVGFVPKRTVEKTKPRVKKI